MFSPPRGRSPRLKMESGGFDGVPHGSKPSFNRMFKLFHHLPVKNLGMGENFFKGKDRFTARVGIPEQIDPFLLGLRFKEASNLLNDPDLFIAFDELLWGEFSSADCFAEILPEFWLQSAERHVSSILCRINLITRISSGQMHLPPLWKIPIHKEFSCMDGEP